MVMFDYNNKCAVANNLISAWLNSGDFQNLEKYSRGWRGAPAKGVGRETGARVQIPLSPLHYPETTGMIFGSFCEQMQRSSAAKADIWDQKNLKKSLDRFWNKWYYIEADSWEKSKWTLITKQ